MNISSIASSTMSLANIATEMKGTKIQQEVSISVLKQNLDMQKMVGEALVGMIEGDAPQSDYLGTLLDIQA